MTVAIALSMFLCISSSSHDLQDYRKIQSDRRCSKDGDFGLSERRFRWDKTDGELAGMLLSQVVHISVFYFHCE